MYMSVVSWAIDCLFNNLFRLTSKKTPKLRVTDENPPVTGRLPSERVSNIESVSIVINKNVQT